MKTKLESALYLSQRGWHVFPTHSSDDTGTCTCQNPTCERQGKHPRTPNGLKGATTDEQIIRGWWAQWPDANIAVRTGAVSGIFVLDVDVKNGAKGFESLAELQQENGTLPRTLCATTPTGGMHYVYKHPDVAVKNRTGFRPGLDIRGDNGYVVVSPSTIGGDQYEWENPDTPISAPPDWLIGIIQSKRADTSHDAFNSKTALQGWTEGQRNEGVFRTASSLRAKDVPYDQAMVVVLEAARNCVPPLGESEAIQCLDSAYGRYEPGTRRKLTDLGNAERLVDQHGEHIRYIPEYCGWTFWNGNRWEYDGLGKINQLAKAVVRNIYNEAADADDPDTRDAISRHAKNSEKKSAIDNMIQLTSKEDGISRSSGALDADPWVFGVRNGVVDLRSGKCIAPRPNHYITKQGQVDFVENAECPTWRKFLLEIMGNSQELVDFLQVAIGYTLTGSTREQAAFILHGTGANGKTTFLAVIETLMGSYCKSVASETFMMQRGGRSSNGPNEDIARLNATRLAATSETEEGQVLAEALLKRMTGEDTLVARLPYAKSSMEFKPQFKVWMAANHKPIIRGDDHAIWRRVRLIPFEQTFDAKREDKRLKEKLLAELPGILNWAIAGCLKWKQEGLVLPKIVKQATQVYRNEMDLLAEWIETQCVVDPDREATTGELYGSYHRWCTGNETRPLGRAVFGRKLAAKGFEPRKVQGARGYQGIGVKRDEDYLRAAS